MITDLVLTQVSTGEELAIPLKGVLVLGRANYPSKHPQAAQVSRLQCEITYKASHPATAELVSCAKQNPTLVIKVADGSRELLLSGESTELHLGDTICLLKTDEKECMRLATVNVSMTQPSGGDMPHSPDAVALIDGEVRLSKTVSATQIANEETSKAPHLILKATVPHPVMLILCGPPGCGKSTFSHNLCAASPIWTRVNQDTVRGGMRGTQQQCLMLARQVLEGGGCVIIDRCHVEPDQRKNFLHLARILKIQAHAVVLNIPPKLCADQAMKRTAHEGGLEGPAARRIAFSMAATFQKHGLPAKSEGLQSILVCDSHRDIGIALAIWAKYPREPSVKPEEEFRAKGGGKRRIDSFFKPSAKVSGSQGASSVQPNADCRPSSCLDSSEASTEAVPRAEAAPETSMAEEAQNQSPRMKRRLDWAQTYHQKAETADSNRQALKYNPADELEGGLSEQPAKRSCRGEEDVKEGGLPRSSGAKAFVRGSPEVAGKPPARKKDVFATLMASAKGKSQEADKQLPMTHSHRFAFGPNTDALLKVAKHPERERSNHPGMEEAADYVIIHDKYPKAALHGLVIARDLRLAGPMDLTAEHLPLLSTMKAAAVAWVAQQRAERPALDPVRLGFHSKPSLRPLHLHIISQDFKSPSLKTKKHWNSFTTDFFLSVSETEMQLQQFGKLNVSERGEELLSQPLVCHRCHALYKTMPALKAHILECREELLANDTMY